MIRPHSITGLFLAALSSFAPVALKAACLPVSGPFITGADLARSDVRLAELPPTLVAGYLPDPGLNRTFTPGELTRIARTSRLTLTDAFSVCFTVPLRPLADQDFAAAMRKSLPSDAELEVVHRSRPEAPAGELLFPLSGLENASAAHQTRTWRGYVLYSGNRRFPLEAQVRIRVTGRALAANTDLPVGIAILPTQVQVVSRDVTFPFPSRSFVSTLEDLVGVKTLRPIRAGELLRVSDLSPAAAVRRGDTVVVEVMSGAARLKVEAVAEASAQPGELTAFRNPASGKTFRARVDSPARASVVLGSGGSRL